MKRTIVALSVASLLAACATSSPDVVSRQDAQRMSTIVDAVVLSTRTVTIDGSQSGIGATTGAVIGGVAGSTIGGRNESIVVGVLGAVVGGMIGNAVERSGTKEEAVEITVQLHSGERRAIVQSKGAETFSVGDPVTIVTNGNKVRVSKAATAR
jgi:outer membrane lipoprotein SlyB